MEIIKKEQILNCEAFSSGIYKCCYYKMINSISNKMNLFNDRLEYVSKIYLCDFYSSICLFYDCYLVSKKNIKDKIYKLNECFKEYETITLNIPKEYEDNIECIFHDYCNNRILIATSKNVISVTEDGYFIRKELDYKDILKAFNYNIENIRNNTNSCCALQSRLEKNKIMITCVGIFCNKRYVGILNNDSFYLLELSINKTLVNKYFIDINIRANNIINIDGCMGLIVTKDNKYNYIYYLNNICKCNIKKNCKKKNCEKNNCNLIESIALMETSLAHILNSEGEKLQKVLKETNNICEILKTNDSVNKTIINTTILEQLLYEKLKLAYKDHNDNKLCNELK